MLTVINDDFVVMDLELVRENFDGTLQVRDPRTEEEFRIDPAYILNQF